MNLNRRIELVCFDLGGVLVRCVDDWAHACERAGVPQLIDEADPAIRHRIINASAAFETARMDAAAFAAAVAADTRYDPSQVAAVIDRWLVELYPGAAELIADLRRAGIATACLSNTNHVHWAQMTDAAGPFAAAVAALDHRHASHLIGHRKPDAAIYERFERAVGVDAAAILFFDDREENVNAAALNLWRAERIDPAKDPAAQMRKYLSRYGVL